MPDDLTPQRFRVPREDRSLLSIPDLNSAFDLVEENRKLFASADADFHGRTLTVLRAAAMQAAIAEARCYTEQLLGFPIPESSSVSCIVSGHQPELFHVGVWAKNFALAGIARQSQSQPLNLVIDNDTLNSTSIRVPVGNREQLRIDRASFDTPRSPLPWEEAGILNRELFNRFDADVTERIRGSWGYSPLIDSAWLAVDPNDGQSERLCDRLTGLRARIERRWGLDNLELPMSRLCETEPFRWFFAHLMMRLPELHRIYNEAVAEYRRSHRIRNRLQPVPDLESSDGWLEAPFWIWNKGQIERGRLFGRRNGSVVELRHQGQVVAQIPYTEKGSLDQAVNQLAELSSRGFRLRTRALTTTLFARVCLSDLFVHGIGGAKYDAMTNRICEQLFGFRAPSFLTVSATLYLPLGGPFDATENQLRDINHRLRDLSYNPDRHLDRRPEAVSLVREKQEILAAAGDMRRSGQLTGHLTSSQHRRLAEIQSELKTYTKSIRKDYEELQAKLRSQLAANALVRNREYPFVLYPELQLQQFLAPLSFGNTPKAK